MKKAQHIKIFSHNDLDGFGAPLLLEAVQPDLFGNVEFDLTTCSAGRIDAELSWWFRQPDIARYSDVYIMDMTPDSDYSFEKLDEHFANHWLIFDHHESEQEQRDQHPANSITPPQTHKNPSATSLVWYWITQNVNFANLPSQRQHDLAQIVELIRAYDTWDWQNDPTMDVATKKAADELNQLFWFYPLNKSEQFVRAVLTESWQSFRARNALLIDTLNDRRHRYLEKHLRSTETFTLGENSFGIVYASDYKSEIAHELLQRNDVDAALVIDGHSVSLRSNGRLDVAKFAAQYFNGGGHADSAGGTLELDPLVAGEQAVIAALQTKVQVAEKMAKESSDNSLGDSIDPEMAAKLANLFK
ncbi:phosphoesterase [Ligilactobacillus saerimneri]|uniref:DHHA1 domain-containing protein n=1 Tax=Ligilactobacillus saerimneri TaxID=228229 RepID=UPI0022A7EEC1|nr:phosphoesterase [Ligilactobacillus saerimneri]